MNITAFDIAQRFVGIKEVPGSESNPIILAMLRLDDSWPETDEVPWCSGFVNWVAWLLRLPRSKSLRARSWLQVGKPMGRFVDSAEPPEVGFDVVVLSRGTNAPGPEVLAAPGHVGLFAGFYKDKVLVLGGNQSDSVSIGYYPSERILGIRRLYEEIPLC